MIFIDKDHIFDGEGQTRAGIGIDMMPLYIIEHLLGEEEKPLPNALDVGEGKLVPFRLYDDDGELYYEGRLHDDEHCENQMAALRFGESDAGCTTIKVLRNNEWTQEIG